MGAIFGKASADENSPYSHDTYIQKALVNDKWLELLFSTHGLDVRLLNPDNVFAHKYIIKFKSSVPDNCNMALLFPTHGSPGKRVLWVPHYAGGDVKTLGRELNQRLRDVANRQDCFLAATSGGYMYRFRGVVGTVYLVWAEYVNIQTVSSQLNTIAKNVPVLVEMDGENAYRSIWVFPDARSTTFAHLCDVTPVADFVLTEPLINGSIFCCESDPRLAAPGRAIPTLSEASADQIATDPVARQVVDMRREERAPFEELEFVPETNVNSNNQPDEENY